MKLKDIALKVLGESLVPMTAKEVWNEAVHQGLDKEADSLGKTPWATVTAYLYTAAKKPNSGIVADGAKPVKFRLGAKGTTSSAGLGDAASQPSVPPVVPTAKPKAMTFLQCAEKVLRGFGAKKPMHYQEITKIALEQGWLESEGKTPEATLYAQVLTDIRKRKEKHLQQTFVQYGKGYVGLAEWMATGIRFQIEEHNKSIKAKLLKLLHKMPPEKFELLICTLLEKMEFIDTEVTKFGGDGGIDVRGTWDKDGIRIRMAIQVKRWKANVQAPVVQAVRGALTSAERGMIITTSDFSEGARKEAEDKTKAGTISLINGEQLVKLLVQYGVGITSDTIEILEIDPEADFAGDGK